MGDLGIRNVSDHPSLILSHWIEMCYTKNDFLNWLRFLLFLRFRCSDFGKIV